MERNSFFGHPVGLAYLLAVEGCWFFGNVGMQALLTLSMEGWLLVPGRAGTVVGMQAYLALLSHAVQPLTPVSLASATFGLFTAASYGAPLLGGLLADRLVGARRAAATGLLLLVAGQLMLLSPRLFLVALGVLVAGNGLAKGNLIAQMGRLYADDDARRVPAFGFYYLAINVASIAAPLICGTLLERGGWVWGYGALAIAAGAGLVVYQAGRAYLPPDARASRPGPNTPAERTPASGRETGPGLACLFLVEVLVLATYKQTFNLLPIWAKRHVAMRIFDFAVPVTWLSAADGLFTIVAIAVSTRLWTWQAARRGEPGIGARLTIGCAFATAGFTILAIGAARSGAVPL